MSDMAHGWESSHKVFTNWVVVVLLQSNANDGCIRKTDIAGLTYCIWTARVYQLQVA